MSTRHTITLDIHDDLSTTYSVDGTTASGYAGRIEFALEAARKAILAKFLPWSVGTVLKWTHPNHNESFLVEVTGPRSAKEFKGEYLTGPSKGTPSTFIFPAAFNSDGRWEVVL